MRLLRSSSPGAARSRKEKQITATILSVRAIAAPPGLKEKARFVLGEMEVRLAALGFQWRETTAAQVYTIYDLHPFTTDEIVKRGAGSHGLTWHYARPPVVGLEFEMDCRGVYLERVLGVLPGSLSVIDRRSLKVMHAWLRSLPPRSFPRPHPKSDHIRLGNILRVLCITT